MKKLGRLDSSNTGPRLRSPFKLSRKHLFIYTLIFAIVGAAILIFTFAAPVTKMWDTQSDFDASENLKNGVTTTNGKVELSKITTPGTGTALPTYDVKVVPNTQSATALSACQQAHWLLFNSPTTPVDPPSDDPPVRAIKTAGTGAQDEWWILMDYYIDPTWPQGGAGGMHYLNFHVTAHDPSGAGAGVSSVWLGRGGSGGTRAGGTTESHFLHIQNPSTDYLLPNIDRGKWYSITMHIIFGRTDGTTPRAGAVQMWVNEAGKPAKKRTRFRYKER